MNKQQLIDTLTSQSDTPVININDLESLLIKYPYFQTAYLLLAQQAATFNHPDFSYILAKTATHASDRTVLYNLYHKLKKENALPISKVQATNTQIITEEKEEVKEDLTIQEALSKQVDKTTSLHDKFVQERKDELPVNESEELVTTPLDTLDVSSVKKKLEKKLAEQEKTKVLQKEIIKEEPISINIPDEENNKSFKTDTSDMSSLIQQEVKAIIQEKSKTEKDEEEDWAEEIQKDKAALENYKTEQIDFVPSNIVEENDSSELENLTISKQKEKTGMDTDSVMSETMAKVYIRQGFYQQAIDIYEGLIGKYPEKKLYFADKIKELNNKL